MADDLRRHVAYQMLVNLPRFGRWATTARDFETPVGQVGYRQLEVLWHLRFGLIPGEVTPKRLAEFFAVQPSVMTRVLARLEAHGLVERAPTPGDRRSVHICITDLGTEISQFVERIFIDELLASMAFLDDADLPDLERSLETLDRIATGLVSLKHHAANGDAAT